MSMLIFKPKESTLSKDFLEKCFENEGNTIGFACINNRKKNNKIILRRRFKLFNSFYKFYERVTNSSVLINITSQNDNLKNYCGPFKIDNNHVMAHTGIIWSDSDLSIPNQSQSANLANIIRPLWNPFLFRKDYFKWMIEEAIPSSNTLVIMNQFGDADIFNKSNGCELSNCWFSKVPNQQRRTMGFGSNNNSHYSYPTSTNNLSDTHRVCAICEYKRYWSGVNNITSPHHKSIPVCDVCRRNGHYFLYLQKCKENNSHSKKLLPQTSHNVQPANSNSFLKTIVGDPDLVNVFDLI